MLQSIKIRTPEGIREFSFVPHSAAFQAARDAGEIGIGQTVVYREFLVDIIDDFAMLILDRITPMNIVPDMPPPEAGWNPGADGMHWSFTVNGVPVDPDVFMGKGT